MKPDQTLLHYRLIEKLGEGGMGVVWRAQDTTLGREVAIKLLTDVFSDDAERLARFEREARLLATLNHPNIAAIYGLHQADDVRFLALELVEGEDLAERLARGPLSVDASLDVGLQVAAALEAAHEKGVVHRDLKPANVKCTPEGKVKVLDFGLAKAFEPDPASGSASLSMSPTMTSARTAAGVIFGTAAYMSPEQARGKPVDKRTDVWSFGCLLYELLTGRKVFDGETVSDNIAKILQAEPDWSVLPDSVPRGVRRLLTRCLQKDAGRRLRDIGDAQIEIQEARDADRSASIPIAEEPASRSGGSRAALWIALAALAGLAIGVTVRGLGPGTESPRQQPAHVAVGLPPGSPLAAGSFTQALALSPDGSQLAYVGLDAEEGVRRLYIRPLGSLEVRALAGTEGAEGPMFSPDGQWVAFYADGRLKKVAVSGGGLPQILCAARDFRGATWPVADTIVITPSQGRGLFRVSASGGPLEALTELDRAANEWTHRFPHALPDGDTILFVVHNEEFRHDRADLWAVSLETGERRRLLEASNDVRYAAGHLLYVQAGALLAQPFDPERLESTGPSRRVIEGVAVQTNTGATQFAVSRAGVLAYVAGEPIGDDVRMVWADRQGEYTELAGMRAPHRYPRLAPGDADFVVMGVGPGRGGMWLVGTEDANRRRLNNGNGGVWSPDGEWFLYLARAEDSSEFETYRQRVQGGGKPEVLIPIEPGLEFIPTSVSPDGASVALTKVDAEGNADLWILELTGDEAPRQFLQTPDNEAGAHFSPDGRYVVYTSDTEGRYETYVTTFPEAGSTWQISTDGGVEPFWSDDGDEIFFRRGGHVMAVSVTTEPMFEAGTPRALFRGAYEGLLGSPGFPNFDATEDGRRFLMMHSPELDLQATQVHLFLDWFTELRTDDG